MYFWRLLIFLIFLDPSIQVDTLLNFIFRQGLPRKHMDWCGENNPNVGKPTFGRFLKPLKDMYFLGSPLRNIKFRRVSTCLRPSRHRAQLGFSPCYCLPAVLGVSPVACESARLRLRVESPDHSKFCTVPVLFSPTMLNNTTRNAGLFSPRSLKNLYCACAFLTKNV